MGKIRRDENGIPYKHKKVLYWAERNLTAQEIAVKTGYDSKWIYKILCRPEIMDLREKLHSKAMHEVKMLFRDNLLGAANKLVEIMEKGKPEHRIQMDAAKEILYQVGLKPVEVVETRTREYTPEEVQSAANVICEIEKTVDRLEQKESEYVITRPTVPVVDSIESNESIEANEVINEPELMPETSGN